MSSIISILSAAGIILLVVLLFNFMIFVHELGHFWAARWRGLYVDRFQIWFGKPLWKKTINGVQWGVGWIPAGGFVSLPQMAPMEAIEGEAELPADLPPVTPLDKIIVAAAGPLSSFALAVAFAFCVWGAGVPDVDMSGTTVGYIDPKSPAIAAGLLPGDRILEIDGNKVDKWTGDMVGVKERIMLGEGDHIEFLVQRPGEQEPRLIKSKFTKPEKKWWQRSAMRQVGFSQAEISEVGLVFPDSPAEKAGLKVGDVVETVNGEKLWSPGQIGFLAKAGVPMTLGVLRPDETRAEVVVTPEVPENWEGLEGATPTIGIAWDLRKAHPITTHHPTPMAQISQSLRWMSITVGKVAASNSDVGLEHLSGPVGILGYFYKLFTLDDGWKLVLWFAVFLNVNLAILNILPFPVFDGGHIVLNALEWIFKRPVGGKFLEVLQLGFVVLIMCFFIFVSFKDVGDMVPDGKDLPSPVFKKVA